MKNIHLSTYKSISAYDDKSMKNCFRVRPSIGMKRKRLVVLSKSSVQSGNKDDEMCFIEPLLTGSNRLSSDSASVGTTTKESLASLEIDQDRFKSSVTEEVTETSMNDESVFDFFDPFSLKNGGTEIHIHINGGNFLDLNEPKEFENPTRYVCECTKRAIQLFLVNSGISFVELTEKDYEELFDVFDEVINELTKKIKKEEVNEININGEPEEVDTPPQNFAEYMRRVIQQGCDNCDNLLIDLIKNDYDERLALYKALVDNDVEKTTCAARYIVREFTAVLIEMNIDIHLCFQDPDKCNEKLRVVQSVYRKVENFLLPQLLRFYQDIKDITPDDAAKMISWYEEFLLQVEKYCPYISPADIWRLDQTTLFDYYVGRKVNCKFASLKEIIRIADDIDIEDRVSNIVEEENTSSNVEERMRNSEDDIQIDTNNHVVCKWPEEITLYLGVNVIGAALPMPYLIKLFELYTEEMSNLAVSKMVELGIHWKTISGRRYCSIINDASRMSKLLTEVHDSFFANYRTTYASFAPKYDGKYHDLQTEAKKIESQFNELANHASSYLCERVFYSLQTPESTLNSIGNQAWEANASESSIMKQVIAAFHYQIVDWAEWLSSTEVYHKLLEDCFDQLMQTYVSSFYTNTMATGVRHASRAASQLQKDYLDLVSFFNGAIFERIFSTSVADLSKQKINSHLLVVLSMSRIIDTRIPPLEVLEDAKTILRSVSTSGENNTPALQHLIGLRSYRKRDVSKRWITIIKHAEQQMSNPNVPEGTITTHETSFICLPDLRRSPYIT